MLGLAIITYNRLDHLSRTVAAVQDLTTSEYRLVVADDGSDDGSVEWCKARGITVVTGPNRGVCWNKNRGLFALSSLGCDPILLLEDDIFPAVRGWEAEWIAATKAFDHLAYAHPKIAPKALAGSGTAEDPYVNPKATAQCSSVSARALNEVGYLDSRFKGYGVGHAEWTSRIKRAGYGYKPAVLPDGKKAKANLYIDGGLKAEDAPSFRDNKQVRKNRELLSRIRREPVHRDPWHSDEEREALLGELAEAGLEPTPASVTE